MMKCFRSAGHSRSPLKPEGNHIEESLIAKTAHPLSEVSKVDTDGTAPKVDASPKQLHSAAAPHLQASVAGAKTKKEAPALSENRDPETEPASRSQSLFFRMKTAAQRRLPSPTGSARPIGTSDQMQRLQTRHQAANVPTSSSTLDAATRTRAFFKSDDNDTSDNLTLSKVLQFSAVELERKHDFIQMLFPTDQRSAFRPDMPVLNGQQVLALRADPAVTAGLENGLQKMLAFYGLRINGRDVEVNPGDDQHVEEWLVAGNHHLLRMTRMIRSLSLLGKTNEATALLQFLRQRVRSMISDISVPVADRMALRHSAQLWSDALHDPVAVSGPQGKRLTYLFPNKALEGIHAALLGRILPSAKHALLLHQTDLLAAQGDIAKEVPLLAHFSAPATVEDYRQGTHLKTALRDTGFLRPCEIHCSPGFYFSDRAGDAEQSCASESKESYEVHVDFSNRCFGGAWQQSHGYAQEEIAFLENAGLGKVAQYAGKIQYLKTYNHDQFGAAFVTREPDGTPAPIIVEGCARVGHFPLYGRVAASLGPENAATTFTQVAPLTTNWLAIAAPDLRAFHFLPEHTGNAIPGHEYEALRASREKAISSENFIDLFNTAHAGFNMALELAGDRTMKLHTGQLGCGVFSNDVMMSTAAQILAARIVGVDQVKFYDYDDRHDNAAKFHAVKDIIDDVIHKLLVSNPSATVGSLMRDTFNAIDFERYRILASETPAV